jgi:hypothetical protein
MVSVKNGFAPMIGNKIVLTAKNKTNAMAADL